MKSLLLALAILTTATSAFADPTSNDRRIECSKELRQLISDVRDNGKTGGIIDSFSKQVPVDNYRASKAEVENQRIELLERMYDFESRCLIKR